MHSISRTTGLRFNILFKLDNPVADLHSAGLMCTAAVSLVALPAYEYSWLRGVPYEPTPPCDIPFKELRRYLVASHDLTRQRTFGRRSGCCRFGNLQARRPRRQTFVQRPCLIVRLSSPLLHVTNASVGVHLVFFCEALPLSLRKRTRYA